MAVVQQQQKAEQKGGLSWCRARKNSKTSLLDLGPPLREPVDEVEESQLRHTVPGHAAVRVKNSRTKGYRVSSSSPRPPTPQLPTSRPPPPPKTSSSSTAVPAPSNKPTNNYSTHPPSSVPPHSPPQDPPSHPPPPPPQPPTLPPLPPSLPTPPPTPSFFPPAKKEDIVVMKVGKEQRKYLKLGLLGRGGSSKVYIITYKHTPKSLTCCISGLRYIFKTSILSQ